MANWATLKAAIAGVIKTNGNQEITGPILQSALNSIISAVGENSTFAGVATPATSPGIPDGPVFYLATEQGTYSNFGGIKVAGGEAVILQWNAGAWTKKTTGLATEQGVYDVSAHNGGAYFNSLQALLSSSDLSTLIPTSVRQGGMSIRFIQGSVASLNNKYVQYRYMGTATIGNPNPFLNTANWQGVDDVPTAGSNNLVKSGGVDNALKGVDVSAYSYAFRYVGNLVDEGSVKAKDKLVRLLNSYCTTANDRTLSELLAIYKSGASELLPYTGTLRGQVNGVPFTVRQNTSSWGKFYTQTFIGPFVFSGDSFNTASGVEHTWVRSIDTGGTKVNYGDWYEPKSGELTLAQLDNPFGFTTVAQWMQGLRGAQSYTFRLVEPTTGRCIGHVWLFNDADNPSNSNLAARTLEVVMCCASINADTGALTYNAINGSPRIYYRSYCAPLTGGTPDGGPPIGNKWSLWQEYRDFVTKPIKETLATLQAAIDATAASIPNGVLNLGTLADETTILARAAQYAVASDPFIAIITAQYQVGTAVQNIVIHQQVTKNSDGSGVCMQYVFKDKARWTRYINFNSAGSVTGTQPLQSDVPRNLHLTDNGGLSLRGLWGGAVGSGITLPNKNDLREGTPTATSVPLVLTKSIKDTVTCNLGRATTARAGVMTVEHVKALQSSTKNAAQIYELGSFATLSELDAAAAALVDGTIQWATNYLPCILLGYYETDCKAIYWQVVENYDEPCVQQIRFSENGKLYRRRILLKEMDFNRGNIIAEQVLDWYAVVKVTATPVYVGGGLCLRLNADESTTSAPLPIATPELAGLMSAEMVNKLADLESRIAALEAK